MKAKIGLCLIAMLAFVSIGCGSSAVVTPKINESAVLSGHLPWNPLQWKVITASVDQSAATMSILYGNDAAVGYARTNQGHEYPPGSVLSLVTWTEQGDAHWFGAKTPGGVKSVEFVSVLGGNNKEPSFAYESYAGSPLARNASLSGRPAGSRADYLLSQRAAVMP